MRTSTKLILAITGACIALVFGASAFEIYRRQVLRNDCGLDLEDLPHFDSATRLLRTTKRTTVLVLKRGETSIESRPGTRYLAPISNLLITSADSDFIVTRSADSASVNMKRGTACVFELSELDRFEPLLIAEPGKPAMLLVHERSNT
jgi:hypothetical protein